MEQLNQIVDSTEGFIAQIESRFGVLIRAARLDQVAIIVGLLLLAHIARLVIAPRLYAWMRTLEGLPKWQLRALLVLHQRVRGIAFVIFAWMAVGILKQVSPLPSHRFLVEGVATLGTAWLIVGLAARLIRNPLLRRLVSWTAWIYVTLDFLGLVGPTESFLDNFAVDLGGFHLSALDVLKGVVVTALLIGMARYLSQGAANRIRANEDMSPSMRVLAVKVMQILLFGTALYIGLKTVGFDLTGLAVLSGAIGVGLGFGLQKVVSNLVSGVILLLDKSIKPGDVISIGDTFGWIETLGARYVSVVTRDGKEFLIPNEDLITGQVVNWSHSDEFVRLEITFGTSYGCDPHLVRRVSVDACKSVTRVLAMRPPVCHIVGFGDSSVDYLLRFWIRDPTGGLANVRGEVFLALWDAFQEHGITIPFPQREVRVLEGSVLETAAARPSAGPRPQGSEAAPGPQP